MYCVNIFIFSWSHSTTINALLYMYCVNIFIFSWSHWVPT
jgi:hypothetical protein